MGGGVLFTVLPVSGLLRLQIFAEYGYEFGKEDNIKIKQSNLFFGIRGDFF